MPNPNFTRNIDGGTSSPERAADPRDIFHVRGEKANQAEELERLQDEYREKQAQLNRLLERDEDRQEEAAGLAAPASERGSTDREVEEILAEYRDDEYDIDSILAEFRNYDPNASRTNSLRTREADAGEQQLTRHEIQELKRKAKKSKAHKAFQKALGKVAAIALVVTTAVSMLGGTFRDKGNDRESLSEPSTGVTDTYDSYDAYRASTGGESDGYVPADMFDESDETGEPGEAATTETPAEPASAPEVRGGASTMRVKNLTPAEREQLARELAAYNTSGEYANGLSYSYTEWSDILNKESINAFGYNQSSDFGNRSATTDGIMKKANDMPEALASYVESIITHRGFTDAELAELGIAGMSGAELDDYMSNPNNSDGNAMKTKLISAMEDILSDEDNVRFEYYYENGTENTGYVYFSDENNDGIITPDEMHLRYDQKTRNNAPQVNVYRTIDGIEYLILDLNMQCGYQPNYELSTGTPVTPPETPPEEPETPPEEPETPPEEPETPPEEPETPPEEPETPPEEPETPPEEPETPPEEPETPPEEPETPPEEPETPPEEPETPPEEPEPEQKDERAEIDNAGGHVTQLELDEEETPPTTYEQDTAGFSDIAEQRAEDAAAAAEAERVAGEQAVAEATAVTEAAERDENLPPATPEQQLQGNEAAAAANQQAQQDITEAAPAIQEQQLEAAAAEAAQTEADAAAEAEQPAAEALEGATQDQLADMWANGDFDIG